MKIARDKVMMTHAEDVELLNMMKMTQELIARREYMQPMIKKFSDNRQQLNRSEIDELITYCLLYGMTFHSKKIHDPSLIKKVTVVVKSNGTERLEKVLGLLYNAGIDPL